MNHFEARLIVVSQKVDSNLLRKAIYLKNFDGKKSNMATEIVHILWVFLRNEFWYTIIHSVLQMTLNFELR